MKYRYIVSSCLRQQCTTLLVLAFCAVGTTACEDPSMDTDDEAPERPDGPEQPEPGEPGKPDEPWTPSGSATITVYQGGEPLAGAAVVIGDENGTAVATEVLDDGGALTAGIVPGSSLTVVVSDCLELSGGYQSCLWTFMGVQPGDELQIGDQTEFTPRLSVELPGAYEGAVGYTIDTGCAAAQASVSEPTVLSTAGCPANASVLAIAYGETGPIAYAVEEGIELPTATNVLEVSLPTWVAADSTIDIELEGDAFDEWSMTLAKADDRFTYDIVDFAAGSRLPSTVAIPARPGGGTQLSMIQRVRGNGEISTNIARYVRVPNGAPLVSAALSRPSFVSLDIEREGPLAVTWETESDAIEEQTDVAEMILEIEGEDPFSLISWYLIGPADNQAIEFPTLPTELADVIPGPPPSRDGEVTNGRVTLYLHGRDTWDDYDDARLGIHDVNNAGIFGAEQSGRHSVLGARTIVREQTSLAPDSGSLLTPTMRELDVTERLDDVTRQR